MKRREERTLASSLKKVPPYQFHQADSQGRLPSHIHSQRDPQALAMKTVGRPNCGANQLRWTITPVWTLVLIDIPLKIDRHINRTLTRHARHRKLKIMGTCSDVPKRYGSRWNHGPWAPVIPQQPTDRRTVDSVGVCIVFSIRFAGYAVWFVLNDLIVVKIGEMIPSDILLPLVARLHASW